MKKILSIIFVTLIAIGMTAGFTWQYTMHKNQAGITMTTADYLLNTGDEITVNITASSTDTMSYIKTTLSYDPEMLEPIVEDTDLIANKNEIYIIDTLAETKSEKNYSLKFIALKEGETSITMYDSYIEDARTKELKNVSNSQTSLVVTVENGGIKDIAEE